MAILKNLVVNGSARFLNTLYANDLTVSGTTSFAGLTTSALTVNGNATMSGTLTLTKTQDLSGTANNSPALIVGGAATSTHIEIDANEIHAKASGTTTAPLYINTDGGVVYLSNGSKISASDGTFTTQTLNVNGTTYYFNSSGNINANGITATNANINKGIFHNAVVEGTLYAVHQEIDHVANLGGVFLVTPTVKCISSGSNKTLTSVTVTASSTTRTNSDGESITYNYSLQINDSAFSTASIGGNNWVQYGEVKVSGNINGTVLGTCDGFIQSINTSTHVLTVAIKYNGDQTLATPSDISTVEDLNVMLKTVYDSSQSKHYPVGIWMKSRDVNGYSHISLYGGTSVDPTVRIGNLQGCPTINGESPTGWGIFTNNGYFSGMIVSNSGKIGNFTISDALYSTAKAFGTTANNVYIGDDGISLGTTFKVTKAGELTATSGSIASWYISSNSLATGTWGTDSSAMLCTGTSGSRSIGGSSSINGWVFTAGANFGVTKAGALYANSAHITGEVTATSGTIGGASISNGVLQVKEANISGTISGTKITAGTLAVGALNSTSQSQVLNSNIEIGGRNLLTNLKSNWGICVLTNGNYSYSGQQFGPVNTSDGLQYVIKVDPNTAYILKAKTLVSGQIIYTGVHQLNSSKEFLNDSSWQACSISGYSFTTLSNCEYLRVTFRTETYNSTTSQQAIDNLGTNLFIKLEKGNKATDWSPSSEDIIDSIEVGGKNLTLASPYKEAINTYNAYVFNTTTSLAELGAGTELTLQLWGVELDSNSTGIRPYWGGGSINPFGSYMPDANGYVCAKATITAEHAAHADGAKKFIYIYNFVNGHSGMSLKIDHWKLEIGNKPTDWTPAPEDVPQYHYVNSSYSQPLSTLQNWATDGSNAGNWDVASTANLRPGDIAAVRCYNTTNSAYLYILIEVTSVISATRFQGISRGLYDPNATKVANDSAKTATNYITKIDSAGIFISPENQSPTTTSPGNSVKIDGTGMNVYKGGDSIAFYGDTTRIGKLDSGNLLARSNGIAVRDGLEELAIFSANGSQIGGDAGKNVQVVPDAIKFNDGSDQIAGMYSYINTMDLGGGDTLTNAGTNFALSGEYNADTGTWDTPHHAMMSGIHVVNTESPGLVNDIAEIEAFAENEQDSSKTSRSSMQTTASDMGLASYDVSLHVGTDFKHISYQLLNTGSSSLSIEADSFNISNNFIVDQNGNLVCNNVGVPNYMTNPTITKSTGSSTCSVVAFSGYGKMRMLILAFTATATISSGSNVFTGTITTTSARPKIAAGGSGFYGSAAVIGNINASGDITIRICGGSVGSGGTIWVYFTYFVA